MSRNKNNALTVQTVFCEPIVTSEALSDLCCLVDACDRDTNLKELKDAVATLMSGMGYMEAERWERDTWDRIWRNELNLLFAGRGRDYVGIADGADGVCHYRVRFGCADLTPDEVAELKWRRRRRAKNVWVAQADSDLYYVAEKDPEAWLAAQAAEAEEKEEEGAEAEEKEEEGEEESDENGK